MRVGLYWKGVYVGHVHYESWSILEGGLCWIESVYIGRGSMLDRVGLYWKGVYVG